MFSERALFTSLIAAIFAISGCASHNPKQPTAGSDEPAIPAASLEKSLSLAYLTGGDLGIGGGFLIGAAPDMIKQHRHAEAVASAEKAEQSPATLQLVHDSTTADLNKDGFVTLDEILALVRSGLNDSEIQDRLKKTGYLFQITPEQERYLTDRGVRQKVVDTLRAMSNRMPTAQAEVGAT